MYWIIAILFLLIGLFQIYLVFSDQHIHFHSQNLSREGHYQPTWRHGHCWWWLSSNDEKKYRQGPGMNANWSFFNSESLALTITILDDDGGDIQLHIGIPYLTSLWLGFERLPLLEKIPYKWRRNFGYETSVKFFSGTLWLHFLYAEMWGTRGLRLRWLPHWIGIHISSGYKEYRGVGFYLSFDFDHLIFGGRKREVENIGDPIVREIPIEPDNSLGLHYFASFQREAEVRWRTHFPWRKTRALYWEIETDNPPLHAGKGENSYDLDDDGIFGMGAFVETVEEAVAKYQQSCLRDRKKYGLPGVIDQAQRNASPSIENGDMKMPTPRIAYDVDRVTHEPVAHMEGRFTMGDLVNVLSQLEKRTGKMPAGLRAGSIDVIPIVSMETGMPMVELQSAAFDKPLQMDHAQAFEFGHTLIEITAISIGDATMFGFINGQLGIARDEAAKMLFAFREYRDHLLSAGDQDKPKGEDDSPKDSPKSI